MRFTSTKKYITGIILFAANIFLLITPVFSYESTEEEAGPVIAGVVINSCIGSITISVTSGTAPYTYAWEDSGGNSVGTNSFIVSGLGPDNYTVTVTDDNGDSITATYTVTNPPDLVGNVVVNNVTCRGDSDAQVVITMSNGNPDYTWELFNSGGSSVQTGTEAFPSNVITIGGLGVDSYTLEVEDDDGCTGTITFNIIEPALFLGATLIDSQDATCSNSTDGRLEVVGTGGWGGYTYAWFNSSSAFLGNGTTLTGLMPGDYTVVITDSNGCQISPTYTIDGPAPITNSSSLSHVTCESGTNGSINITPGGGNGTFSYLWNTGATSQDLTGLTAGNYSITITDIQGCTFTENFTITEPAILLINESVTDVSCHGGNDGSISSNVSGGTSPYTYLWSTGATSANLTGLNAGNYDLTVTDDNGCQTMESFTVAEPATPLSVDGFTPTLPTCFGGSDGTLQVNVSGGTGPYTYLWSSGATSSTATGLSSGAQAVTITDANGCVTIGNFTLNDPVAISIATVISIPSCNGGADGSIIASASNGAGPYTYNWNTGDVGPNINGLTAGSYQLTVTDAGGCSVVENVTVGEPDPIVSNAAVNDISCNGLTDGNISLAVTGGTGPYTYLWNTGATSSSISGLSAGPYDVTITDDNGCTAIDNFVIIDPAPIGSSLTQTDVLCRGNATGAINLTPSGGTLPYTYLWSNGATTQDISSLLAGTYTVTITDASLCSTVASTTITQPATALQISGVETDASCNGSTNGAIDLTITGGIAPYTVLWNTGITTEDITALASGNYSVQVTDANGCVSSTSFTIDEPTPLIATPTVSDISCNGANDGTINVSVSGGTAPYTYSWADGPSIKDRSGLSPGNYTLTTTDANGCQNVQPLVINEPAVLTTSVAQQNVNCFGESTGIINLSVSGGTAPYSYAWADGPTIEDRTALTAGNYNVTVTDANGCTSAEMITITEPASALTFTNTVQQISCNGAADGIINLTVSGGTAPYSYNWSNGSSSEDLSGLPAAVYNVTITDALGCTTTGSFTITDPPVLVVSGSETDVTCFGASDGSIDLTVSGGEAPYTYMWAHGPTSQDVSGLGPGAYSVQIVDNRGCSQLTSFTIDEPTVLNLSYTKSDIACFGGNDGSIDLTVNGGTGPYTYAWDHGSAAEDLNSLSTGSYIVTVTDANGCSAMEAVMIDQPSAALFKAETITNVTCNGFSNGIIDVVVSGGTLPYSYSWNDGFTTQDRLGLSPGTYALTITDANGCQLIDSYTITQPGALSSSTSIDQVSCFGAVDGEIDLTVSGGTGTYSYLWSDGATTEDRDNLSPGNYSVTVTDDNGCQVTESVTITEPAALSITEVVTDIACFGNASGAIDITVSGGTAPYVYAWSGGEISEDLTGLTAGTFSVTITDTNNCTFNKDIVVSQPAQPLAINEIVNDISCFGANDGTIQLNITGGTAPYTYVWDHGATTEDIAALLTGNYNVLVTDANGCTTSGNFTIDSPAALQISSVVEDLTCNGAGDGTIDLTVTGGSAPYTYAWSNGATTEDLSGVAADNYMVSITDANGCSLNRSFTVTEPLILEVSGAVTNVLCFGEGDGAIDVNTTGGTGPYVYSWSNGAVTEDLFNINGGSYTLTVTDANGCQSVENFNVTEPVSSLSIAGTITDVSCFGANNGTITTTINGGTAPYVYSWNQGAITQNLSGQAPGGYQLTVTDANGCSVSESFTIQGPAILQVSKSISNLSCFEANDGAIDLTITGGAGPYLFAWSHGPTSEDLSALSAGTYQVQITDANGCSINETVDIQQPAILSLAHNTTDVSCFAGNDGSIDLTISGGTFPFTYNWSNGTTTEDLSTLQAGSYAVTVTDAQGCSISQTIAITEPTAALSATATLSDLTCFGADNGSIDLNLSGGTLPYAYQWNTGAITEDISGLLPGTYQVTVTDNNGCEIIRDYTISTPQPLAITGAVTDISCRGAADGAIAITPSGGTAPYSYSWSTGATTQNISSLDIGGYSVLVTDANGCTTSTVYTITQPLDLVINNIVTDVSCFGADDGKIDLTITGGTAPYSYEWSNGETTQDIQNLTGGAQTVRVLDARGCQVTAVISVGAPSAPLAADAVISDVACNGATSGRIDLTMTGGTGPYSYSWSNGSSQPNLLNVFAGSYEIIVTDAKGCIFNNTYEISEPDAITVAFDITNTSCFGDNDGGIAINPEGGTGPYTYVWSNSSTSKNQVNLGGGTYNVTITDANNCSIVRSVTVGDASDLTVTVNKVDVLCKGETSGAIDLTVTGGSGIYNYQWGDGETTQNLNQLPAGIYQVLVSDGGGCATTASVVISEPAANLDIQVDKSPDFTCFGQNNGFAKVTPLGGVAPYAYLWSNGARTAEITNIQAGDYTVNVTDANGCSVQQVFRISQPDQPISLVATGNLDLACLGNTDGNIQIDVTGGTAPYTYLWSTGSNENELNNLIAGDYTLRVVDALGCTIEQTFTVRQPDALRIANAFVNESQCFDDRNGSIELEIDGGTGPYQYQWSNGATTKNIIGISSGEYSVVVTDDRGCAVQAAYQLADPSLFRLNPEVSVISCVGENDASISLNIEGGVGDLIIRWNTGQVGETLSDLAPGIYNVTVSDENSCSLQQTFNIIEPLPVTLDAFVQDAIECGKPSSGQINLIVSGGRAPYTYRWSNGATNQRLTELFPGTYAVTVTDAFGCSATGTYSVQQPDPLKIGLRTQILVDCDNRTVDNQVSAEVSGGFGGYKYEWSRGSGNGSEITVSEPGRLTLIITDDNGCTLEKSVDISIPELGEADFDFTSESIVRDGEATANDPVSFFDDSFGDIIDWAWDFGDGFDSREVDPIHTYSAPGTYTVTLVITDGSGCTSLKIETIEITEGYRVMVPDAFTPNGDGNNDFFRPRLLGLEKVQLMVFNTWGEVIFNTEDVQTPGWDGTIRGKPAENGNYIYKLVGRSFNGLEVERDGVFALIK